MNILLYAPSIHTGGGTERVLVNLSNELVERGFNIEIFSQTIGCNKLYKINKSVSIRQLAYDKLNQRFKNFFFYKLFKKVLGRYLLQLELDLTVNKELKIIIAFSNSIVISCFDTTYRNKLIAFEHWPYWKTKKNLKLKRKVDFIYPKLKRVIVLTKHDSDIYNQLGCNVIVIPNACFYFPELASELEFKNVLSVGHFNDQKRRDLLIEAWRIIHDIHLDWILTIVGNGELKLNCFQKIIEYNLQDSIKIIEPTDKIAEQYADSSIFILSSEYEALPLVLIEAKSYGIPCVSFDIETGPNEIIRNEIDGFLVPFGDCEGLAEKTCRLIGNFELRKDMGSAGRLDILSRFNNVDIYNTWESLIRDL